MLKFMLQANEVVTYAETIRIHFVAYEIFLRIFFPATFLTGVLCQTEVSWAKFPQFVQRVFFINSREIDLIEFIFFNDYRLFLITLYFMRMGSTFLYFKGENLNLTK